MANLLLQQPPDLAGQPQVYLRERDFDALVWNKGYDVIVEKSVRCPCRNKPDHQAVLNCRNCGGTGWLFINPILTSIVLQSMNYDTKFKDWGEEKLGMGKATFMNRELISFMDKITIQNGEMITTQVLHPTKWENGENMCRSIYPIKELDYCFLYKGPTQKLERLRVGEGIEIDKEQYIILDEGLMQENCTISIRYLHKPVFHVIDIPRVLMVTPEIDKSVGGIVDSSMPLLATVRLAHYIINQNNYSGDWLFDNSDYDFCTDGRLNTKEETVCN